MGKPTEFSDTNEAGRKYKSKPKSKPKPSSRSRSRSSSARAEQSHIPDTQKIRKDLEGYRKRVLQAPGKAAGMRDD